MKIVYFEKQLCLRIEEICNHCRKKPADNEADIQEAFYRDKKIKHTGSLYNNFKVDKEVSYEMRYFESQQLFPLLPRKKSPRNKNFHIDLEFRKQTADETHLVELKYPAVITSKSGPSTYDNRWKYSGGMRDSFIAPVNPMNQGKSIITHPVIENGGVLYLTDEQEGKMFIDFIRLCNAHHYCQDLQKINLYFCVFFKLDDIADKNKNIVDFCHRYSHVLTCYKNITHQNDDTLIFTRGSTIDIWDYEPCKISYFYKEGKNLELVEFDPVSPHIEPLHTGPTMAAFLIKIDREIASTL